MGTSRLVASALASFPHSHQSTGLEACCRRYGDVAIPNRFIPSPYGPSVQDPGKGVVMLLRSARAVPEVPPKPLFFRCIFARLFVFRHEVTGPVAEPGRRSNRGDVGQAVRCCRSRRPVRVRVFCLASPTRPVVYPLRQVIRGGSNTDDQIALEFLFRSRLSPRWRGGTARETYPELPICNSFHIILTSFLL